MNGFSCKHNWAQALERQTAFWQRKMGHGILARLFIRNPPLDAWLAECRRTLPLTSHAFPPRDTLFKTWDLKLRAYAEVTDDSLPVMIPTEFDEGLFGAIFSAPTTFNYDPESGWMASMSEPFWTEYPLAGPLAFNDHSLWMQELRQRLPWYAEQADGKFGLSPVISIDSLNFAVLAFGPTRALLDLYDAPDCLRQLFEQALALNIRLNRLQKQLLGGCAGGALDGYAAFGSGFAGDEINISVDAYGMARREVFSGIGLEYTQRLIDAFGSAFLHLHGNAHHLLPDVLKLRGLKGIWIVDEEPHPFSSLAEIRQVTGDMPLVTECLLNEFLEGLQQRTLPGGVYYIVRGHKEGRATLMSPAVNTAAEANAIMKKVRDYRL